MPPAALSERDQAFTSSIADGILAGLRTLVSPPKPDTAPQTSLEELLNKAAPGSTVKVGDFELQLPAAKAEKPGEAKAPASAGEAKPSAEAELGAKLLAPIERPLAGIQVQGIPAGQLLFGGILGFGAAEILNGFISPIKLNADGTPALSAEGKEQVNFNNAGLKAGLAIGLAFVGPSVASRNTVIGMVVPPAVQAAGDILPLDRLVNWLVKKAKANGDAGATQRIRNAQRTRLALGDGHSHGSAGMGSTTVFAPIADIYRR